MGASKEFPITDHEFIPCNCGDPDCKYCAVCHEQKCFHAEEIVPEESSIPKHQEKEAPMIQHEPPPVDPEFFKIARLFLEKYEILADEDRRFYRRALVAAFNPPMFVSIAEEKAQ